MMTQDERWKLKFDEAMEFMEKNHRNPSRHRLEEHEVLNWIKHNRKVMNAGAMKTERLELFKVLLAKVEEKLIRLFACHFCHLGSPLQ